MQAAEDHPEELVEGQRGSAASVTSRRVRLADAVQPEPDSVDAVAPPGPRTINATTAADQSRPTAQSSRSRRNRPRQGEPADEGAPTIQVHIGRIEVDATAPPTSGPRSRRPRPSLSLEEYARLRGGRGR